MFCEKCGAKLDEGQKFCNNCGNQIKHKKVMNNLEEVKPKESKVNEQHLNQSVTEAPNVVNNPNNTPNYNNVQNPPKKKNTVLVIVLVVGAVIVAFIGLFIAIFALVASSSNKLVCESNEGNITLLYDDDSLNGYTANGITYDLEGQQDIAERIGIESYISQFDQWFRNNTTGTCVRKK